MDTAPFRPPASHMTTFIPVPSRRSVIVTGAAQGIGRSIALRLARDGLNIAINDLESQREKLESLAAEIAATPVQQGTSICVTIVIGDISTEEGVQHLVATVVRELGGLDVMVANAGIAVFGTLLDTSVEDWDRMMAVNARGTFLLYKHAAQQMIKQGRGGRIIGAASMAGKRGFPNIIAYVASKFAIRGITQTAALELGPHNITVNAYAPGLINTEMADHPDNGDRGPGAVAKVALGLPENAPLGKTEDVAALVSFWVREESRFITGQSISIDGGIYFD